MTPYTRGKGLRLGADFLEYHFLTFEKKIVTLYANELSRGPALPPIHENQFLMQLGVSRKPIKLCVSSCYKALCTILGTAAYRHLATTQLLLLILLCCVLLLPTMSNFAPELTHNVNDCHTL